MSFELSCTCRLQKQVKQTCQFLGGEAGYLRASPGELIERRAWRREKWQRTCSSSLTRSIGATAVLEMAPDTPPAKWSLKSTNAMVSRTNAQKRARTEQGNAAES